MTSKKGEQPLVSVIIPVWNRRESIKETVRSVVESTYKNIEIIISDNNSDDGTWDILKKISITDNRIKLIRQTRNIGPIGNWLACLEQTSGKFIKFVWSDDAVDNDTIESLLKPLIDNDKYKFSYCPAKLEEKTIYNNKSNLINIDMFVIGFAIKSPWLPYSPGTALVAKIELSEFKKKISEIPDCCIERGIGPDLIYFYMHLLNGNSGIFVDTTKVTFNDSTTSITRNTDKKILNDCYDRAVLCLLKNEKHRTAYLVLRYVRSILDFQKHRSYMTQHLKKEAFSSSYIKESLYIIKLVSYVFKNYIR